MHDTIDVANSDMICQSDDCTQVQSACQVPLAAEVRYVGMDPPSSAIVVSPVAVCHKTWPACLTTLVLL